jgi:hypothetical protein
VRTAVGTLLRRATRGKDEPLNILTVPTHERCESALALTGHQFWALSGPGFKSWNPTFSPLPANYRVMKGLDLPAGVDFDLVLSQSRFAHYPYLSQVANQFQIPLVTYEHTMVYPDWSAELRNRLRAMAGHANVFISETSKWGWGFGSEGTVIEHGIDTDLFKPIPWEGRNVVALSVVNDWINRDAPCGYHFWREATRGLPVRVVGDTPGLSEAAPTLEALGWEYARAKVFVNTSQISPIPMALLEGMSSGCICVSTDTCEIPSIIKDGENGLLAKTPAEMRLILAEVLSCPDAFEHLGKAARQTVLDRFNLKRFVSEWDAVLRKAAAAPFTKPLYAPG